MLLVRVVQECIQFQVRLLKYYQYLNKIVNFIKNVKTYVRHRFQLEYDRMVLQVRPLGRMEFQVELEWLVLQLAQLL